MDNDDKNPQYWNGKENKAIRIFFYCQRGVAIVNEFRNPFLIVAMLYFALKLDNPLWLFVMCAVFFPLICVVGWISVHRMGRVIDYLNVRFSTHYAKKQFDIFEGMLSELKKMNSADLRSQVERLKNKKIKNSDPLTEVFD